jgi:hypothetical protein
MKATLSRIAPAYRLTSAWPPDAKMRALPSATIGDVFRPSGSALREMHVVPSLFGRAVANRALHAR